MKFMIGEGGWSWLERASYRGAIGLFYDDTLGGVLSYLIFGVIMILAIIGLFTVLGFVFGRLFGFGRKKKDPEKEWLRTGKFK